MSDLCRLTEEARDWIGRAMGLAGQKNVSDLWRQVENRLEVEGLTGRKLSDLERALLSHVIAKADSMGLQAFEIADNLNAIFCRGEVHLAEEVQA